MCRPAGLPPSYRHALRAHATPRQTPDCRYQGHAVCPVRPPPTARRRSGHRAPPPAASCSIPGRDTGGGSHSAAPPLPIARDSLRQRGKLTKTRPVVEADTPVTCCPLKTATASARFAPWDGEARNSGSAKTAFFSWVPAPRWKFG